jgi:hypothetical protein
MIITKLITVGLDILNPINVCSDIHSNILNILIDKYEKKCFRGCYIQSINKIVKMDDCYINQEGPPNQATMGVIFEVTAIIYPIGEIVNGCKVVKKDKKTGIICSSDYASILLNYEDAFDSIQVNQIISVRVGGARYNIGTSKISINAIPFLPFIAPIVYKINPATISIKETLQDILKYIAEEEKLAESLKQKNAKGWEFFEKLIYNYKADQEAPKGAKVLKLQDLINGKVDKIKYLSRDQRINLVHPITYGYDEMKDLPTGVNLKEGLALNDIMMLLFGDYYNNLKTVREMLQIYGNPEMLESHKNLWLIFRKYKA